MCMIVGATRATQRYKSDEQTEDSAVTATILEHQDVENQDVENQDVL